MKLLRFSEASKEFEGCVEINPDYADSFFKLGYCKTKLKMFKEGLEYFDKNLKNLTIKTENFFKKGYALSKIGKAEEALLDLYQDGTITLDIIKAKTGKSDEEIEETLNGHKI